MLLITCGLPFTNVKLIKVLIFYVINLTFIYLFNHFSLIFSLYSICYNRYSVYSTNILLLRVQYLRVVQSYWTYIFYWTQYGILSKSGNLTSFSHYISPIPLHPPLVFLSKFSSANQTVKYRLAIGWLFL